MNKPLIAALCLWATIAVADTAIYNYDKFKLPSSNNANHQNMGIGTMDFNTDIGAVEFWNGTTWVGAGAGGMYIIGSTLPTCNASNAGVEATVSNGVASPTYFATVSTTGPAIDPVFCNYNGTTYQWVYQ